MTWDIYAHHRGPYRLQVIRLTPTRKCPYATETLPGTVETDDIPTEAQALLDDPRDSIIAVIVWSDSEQQHVTTYNRKAQP